jgi:hypothetical protein
MLDEPARAGERCIPLGFNDIRVDSWYLKGDSEVEMPIRHERVEAANIFFLARLHQSLQR